MRKSEIRIRENLPNGQQMNLYFKRHAYHEKGIAWQWHIGFYIGDRKEANQWYNTSGKKQSSIKGNGSLTALKWAKDRIVEFMHQMPKNEEIAILWEDDKRMRAYKYMTRYGFMNYEDEHGNTVAFGGRNPKHWEWVEGEEVGVM